MKVSIETIVNQDDVTDGSVLGYVKVTCEARYVRPVHAYFTQGGHATPRVEERLDDLAISYIDKGKVIYITDGVIESTRNSIEKRMMSYARRMTIT